MQPNLPHQEFDFIYYLGNIFLHLQCSLAALRLGRQAVAGDIWLGCFLMLLSDETTVLDWIMLENSAFAALVNGKLKSETNP